MSIIVSGSYSLSWSKPSPIHGSILRYHFIYRVSKQQHHSSNSRTLKENIRWRQNFAVVRCCSSSKQWQTPTTENNYYELLGVSVDSKANEIREAYRKLQKMHHPDIVGQKGHAYTLILNKAYEVLMTEDLRRKYDESIGHMRLRFGENNTPLGYSTWKGSVRPQALFVDENACIGCRECVHHASNTFIMDEAHGCARVKVQYGDNDRNIEVSIDSCPVNCIHWVDTKELTVLEFLVQPQPKAGYGIFGGGWERPENVFTAAESFNKQLRRKATTRQNQSKGGGGAAEEENPAQAEARAQASMKMKIEGILKIWNWVKGT